VSYAQFSEGDVYLYAPAEGGWLCMGCKLARKETTELYRETFKVHKNQRFTDLEDVENHIYEHLSKGHQLPPRCLKQIQEEMGNA